MKRFIIIALAAFMLFVFTSCTGQQPVQEVDIPLADIAAKIEDAYGENYLPNMEIPPEQLEAEFGLSESMYEDIVGVQPLMSTHPDRVVIVKAASGQADDVEKALLSAKETKIGYEVQYPVNIPKTNAAKVVRNGNYVAFLLVGAPLDDLDASQEDAAVYFESEVNKAVDAFHAAFN